MKTMLSFLAVMMCAATLQAQVVSFDYDGRSRQTKLHIPPTYDGTEAVPLIFNFHGLSSNALEQEFYSKMNEVADTAGFIVAYPDGIGDAWNAGWFFNFFTNEDDLGFTSALLDTLGTMFNIDPTRVYSTGMSNGGFMSYNLACNMDDRIAAVASVTGSMALDVLASCNPSNPMPVLQIHGTADNVVFPDGLFLAWASIRDVLTNWAVYNDCDEPTVNPVPDIAPEDETTSIMAVSPCSNGAEVRAFKTFGATHTWPGGANPPIVIPGFNVFSNDFSGSGEIWKFFRRFSRPDAPEFRKGIVATEQLSMQVFPNPATESIQLTANGKGVAQILDLSGRVVRTFTVNGYGQAKVSDLPTGLYVIQFENAENSTLRSSLTFSKQ